MLRRQTEGKNNSWAIRWNASLFLNDILSLNVGKSLVQNIGFDGSGTNCGGGEPIPVRALYGAITGGKNRTDRRMRRGKESLLTLLCQDQFIHGQSHKTNKTDIKGRLRCISPCLEKKQIEKRMRVLIINTSENIGGAAIAANRLMEALKNNGVKAKMLVRDKRTDQITVASLPQSPLLKAKFVWERVCIWKANRFKKHNLFQVDLANTGTDVTSLPEFKEADVIHLHWINQGFLSLKDIRRIIDSGKPIVWTMHDQWPFTGICHYSGGVHEIPNRVPPLPPASARRRHA